MMRFGFSFLTLLYSFGLVTGCGNQNSRLELETGGLKAPAAVSAAQEIFADAKVTCSNPQRCPGYLAMLVILPDVPEPNELPSTCTGFLVEKDLLLTSAECLPASLQRAGASCRHKIQAFFPRTPQNQVERVGCSVVVSISAPSSSETSISYAFLRLNQPINVEVPKISHDGFRDEGSYWTHRVHRVSKNSLQAKIRSRSCRAVQNSMALPSFSHDEAPQVSLGGCSIEESSRGAPILDREDQVRGILHSEPSQGRLSLVQDEIIRGTALPLVFATNMSCVSIPGQSVDRPLPFACSAKDEEEDLSNILRERLRTLRETEEPKLLQALHRWAAGSDMPFLRWKFASAGEDDVYIPEPDCFLSPSSGWTEEFRRQDVDVRFDLPVWRLQVGLGLHLQPTAGVFVDRTKRASFVFNPSEVARYGFTLGTLTGESVIRKERLIRVCK